MQEKSNSLKRVSSVKAELQGDDVTSWFFRQEDLGLLEPILCQILNPSQSTRRQRAVLLQSISSVLRKLNLIPPSSIVLAVSLGCLKDGTRGMFVSARPARKVIGQFPQQPPERVSSGEQ